MTTQQGQKLKTLFRLSTPGAILFSTCLEQEGISKNLQQYYLRNGWLTRVGQGVYMRPGDTLNWWGAISALQHARSFPVHVGALTALSMHGYGHYVRLAQEKIFLFSSKKRALPQWTHNKQWHDEICFRHTAFIRDDSLGVEDIFFNNFKLIVSIPERAIIEVLHLVPDVMDFMEAYQLMESMSSLRPAALQNLLEACGIIRVKRLFLYLATRAELPCVHHLDRSKIDLGSGIRSISKGGVYEPNFMITVPKEIAQWQ